MRRATINLSEPVRSVYSRMLLLLAACAAIAMGNGVASACQTPVCRYALERWRPQLYEVVVFHRGSLSKEQRSAVRLMEEFAPPANLVIRDVDLEMAVDEEVQKLFSAQRPAQLPWAVAQVQGPDGQMRVIWSGALDLENCTQLVDSPARRTVCNYLLAGDSAVWVMIEGGDKRRDDDAFRLLQAQLKNLEGEITMPVPDPRIGGLLSDLPLNLKFSLVRLSREDPDERAFLQMLLFGDPSLLQSREPIVVPVFGRGRALGCLVGKDIHAASIRELAIFLCGQCSCEVKEQNPGYDLLMAADWDSIFREHAVAGSTTAPTQVHATEPPIVAPATVVVRGNEVVASLPAKDVAPHRRGVLLFAIVFAGLLTLFFGWRVLRSNRAQ